MISLIFAIAAIVLGILGITGVVTSLILSVSLLVAGLVLLAENRGWVVRR